MMTRCKTGLFISKKSLVFSYIFNTKKALRKGTFLLFGVEQNGKMFQNKYIKSKIFLKKYWMD